MRHESLQKDTIAEQELLLSAFVEEQDKWSQDIKDLETQILESEKELLDLQFCSYDTWWEKILGWFGRESKRIKAMGELVKKREAIQTKYEQRMKQAPRAAAYEIAMLGGRIFVTK